MKSWHVIEARRYVIEKNVCYLFILLHNLPFKIHFSITRHLILCLPNNTFSRVFNKNCIPIMFEHRSSIMCQEIFSEGAKCVQKLEVITSSLLHGIR